MYQEKVSQVVLMCPQVKNPFYKISHVLVAFDNLTKCVGLESQEWGCFIDGSWVFYQMLPHHFPEILQQLTSLPASIPLRYKREGPRPGSCALEEHHPHHKYTKQLAYYDTWGTSVTQQWHNMTLNPHHPLL